VFPCIHILAMLEAWLLTVLFLQTVKRNFIRRVNVYECDESLVIVSSLGLGQDDLRLSVWQARGAARSRAPPGTLSEQ